MFSDRKNVMPRTNPELASNSFAPMQIDVSPSSNSLNQESTGEEENPHDLFIRNIRQRLEAGQSPGKVAMDLEQVQAGLGRAMLPQIKQLAVQGSRAGVPWSHKGPVQYGPLAALMDPSFPKSGRFESLRHADPDSDSFLARKEPGTTDAPHAPGKLQRPFVQEVMFRSGDEKWGPSGLGDKIGYSIKREAMKSYPQIEENFNTAIKGIVGSGFSDKEYGTISAEIIANLDRGEAMEFEDYQRGKDGTLFLNDRQWGIVQKLINGFPEDSLGKRVRAAYATAVKTGRLRHRKR